MRLGKRLPNYGVHTEDYYVTSRQCDSVIGQGDSSLACLTKQPTTVGG
jgi:hypothetical protein